MMHHLKGVWGLECGNPLLCEESVVVLVLYLPT
jgi:hypothetical protein